MQPCVECLLFHDLADLTAEIVVISFIKFHNGSIKKCSVKLKTIKMYIIILFKISYKMLK